MISPALIDRNEFYGRYMALDNIIDRFTASLPPIDRSGNPDAALTSLVTHTLARAATIQLRSNFKDHDRMNDRKDLAAAQAASAALENLNIPPNSVDPILAVSPRLDTFPQQPCSVVSPFRSCGLLYAAFSLVRYSEWIARRSLPHRSLFHPHPSHPHWPRRPPAPPSLRNSPNPPPASKPRRPPPR